MASKKKSIKAEVTTRPVVAAPEARIVTAPAAGHFSQVKTGRKASVRVERRRLTGRLLVRLKPDASMAVIGQKAKARGLTLVSMKETPMDGGLVKALEKVDGIVFDRLRIVIINESGAARMKRLMALRDSPFLSGEPERYLYKQAKGASGHGPLRNTASATWGIQAINVRNSSFTGKDVRMAILDTGFDFTHPDFAGRVIHRQSFVGRQAKDREGHGTFCAGIAGGNRKGKTGARYGVAPGSRLYIGKILDDAGEGSDGQALAGIEWALEKGCQVVSMSFGAEAGETYSEIFEDVARTAMANHCLLIAATGNESDREEGLIAPVNHPANCPSVMAVAALTESLKVANYSCGGKGRRRGVNIAAPGDNILSASIGGGYGSESGTSMAAPFVAGVAALLWEQYPKASAKEIWDKLIRQAESLGASVQDVGAGLVYVR